MHTFFATLQARRPRRGRTATTAEAPVRALRSVRAREAAGSQEGFLLVEVIVSALLVALIVVATFNGFDVANRLSADQRHHDQAAVLAAQSQEQLRTDPASALVALETAPHVYTREVPVGGTKYTITQEAHPVAASGSSTGCNANETAAQTGANIEVTSSVTWPQLVVAKRPAVKQASVISPPTGSAVEVDVTNKGTTGVPGVTAVAKYQPVSSGAFTTAEGTTASAGCVVLSGIQATSASVEIVKRANFITPAGLLEWPTKELSIAPNLTTHYPVQYDEGGRIVAEFTYKGKPEFESKKVTGDTFVVFNSLMAVKPEYQLGSTAFEYEIGNEEHYKALTGTYSHTATTAVAAKYATGDLFPFPTSWSVYAGDCKKNNVGSEAAASKVPLVEPGKLTIAEVPMSYVLLKLYKGTQVEKGALETTAGYPVQITDSECEAELAPNNAIAANLEHNQVTLTEGKLTNPFQPFGPATLCVYSSTKKRSYSVAYTNSTAAGSTVNVFLNEPSEAERATAKAKAEGEEATAKTKRLTEEAATKSARESEEATTKTTRTTNEAKEVTKWKEEELKKTITKAQKEAKEATQKTARVKAEKEESEKKIAKEKTESEAKKKAEEKEASTKTTRETKEAAELPSAKKESKEDSIGNTEC
jgi:hypothetical protein